MAAIRGKDTKPEMLVRRFLHKHGFRFRLHRKGLPGKPDIVLPKYRTAIFVHGCFWHSHDCKNFVMPTTRQNFWKNKLAATSARDAVVTQELRNQGWRVVTVWECGLSSNELETLILDLTNITKNLI